jgi:hypothetical protein
VISGGTGGGIESMLKQMLEMISAWRAGDVEALEAAAP